MKKISKYLVIRIREVLGYRDYFGPMVSYSRHGARTPLRSEAQADAERLFGKPGHRVEIKPWSVAPKHEKAKVRERKTGD